MSLYLTRTSYTPSYKLTLLPFTSCWQSRSMTVSQLYEPCFRTSKVAESKIPMLMKKVCSPEALTDSKPDHVAAKNCSVEMETALPDSSLPSMSNGVLTYGFAWHQWKSGRHTVSSWDRIFNRSTLGASQANPSPVKYSTHTLQSVS